MVLTTVEEDRTLEEARYLLSRTRQTIPESGSRAIIETITTILAYRFGQLSRVEIEAMLDITLQETRLYRDIKEEGERFPTGGFANAGSATIGSTSGGVTSGGAVACRIALVRTVRRFG